MAQKKHNKNFYDEPDTIRYVLSKDKTFVKKYPIENDSLKKSLMAITLPSMIYQTLENNGRASALERIRELERVVKYVPQNFDIYSLLEVNSDLPYIAGKFSTFDYELANMKKHDMPTHLIHARANDISEKSVFHNAEKLANDIIKLVLSKRFINTSKYLEKSDSCVCYSAFLTALAEDLAIQRKIPARVSVFMLETWDKAPKYVKKIKEDGYKFKGIYIRRHGINGNEEISEIFICKSCLDAKTTEKIFFETLSAFAHEFGHFIDYVAPDRGALGAQIMAYCGYQKTKTQTEYFDTPTEKSSYKIQEMLTHQIRQLIQNKR